MLVLLPGRVLGGDAFEQASRVAYEILGKEISSPMCQPPSASEARRRALVTALESITTVGLADATGLTPLDYAVFADDVPSIERLVAIGYALDTRDIHDGTLLHSATLVGSQKSMSFLLSHGADPNARNSGGGTPLMVAVSQNRPELVWPLIEAGASAALRTSAGLTALHYALPCKDPEVISALLDAGAPIDAKAKALSAKFGIALTVNER